MYTYTIDGKPATRDEVRDFIGAYYRIEATEKDIAVCEAWACVGVRGKHEFSPCDERLTVSDKEDEE